MDLQAANYSGKGGVIWAGGLLTFQDAGEVLPGAQAPTGLDRLDFPDGPPGAPLRFQPPKLVRRAFGGAARARFVALGPGRERPVLSSQSAIPGR